VNQLTSIATHADPIHSGRGVLLRIAIRVYIRLLSAGIVLLCFLDFANYLNIIIEPLLPKYIYALLMVAAAPIIVVRWKALSIYSRTHTAIWFYSLAVLDLIHWFVLSAYGNVDAATLTLTRIQFLLLGLILGFVLTLSDPRFLAKCFIVTGILLACLQLLDFGVPGLVVPPGTEGVIPGHAASTLVNANKATESLVLLFIFGAPALKRSYRLWFYGLIFAGILVAFSRSGIMIAAMVLGYCFVFKLMSRKSILLSLLVFVGLLIVAGNIFLDDLLGFVGLEGMSDISNRIMFFSDPNFSDSSADERLAVARYAFVEFLRQPIFGAGSGFTSYWSVSDVSTHNMQLLILAEYGILGYMFLLWLFILMLKGGSYFKSMDGRYFINLFVLVFSMFTLFTHNMFDFLYWLVAFILASHRGFKYYRSL
jgi:hypothetical protein